MNYGDEVRTQNDGLQEAVSQAETVDCSNMPDLARQEFKAESDTQSILKKFGVEAFHNRPILAYEFDDSLDLKTALDTVRQTQEAYQRLPDNIKQRFPDWNAVALGVEKGEILLDKPEENSDTTTTAPTPTP